MDPKHCPHCEYEWTPRKENPVKCPRCQNPLWKSSRPKRAKGQNTHPVRQPIDTHSEQEIIEALPVIEIVPPVASISEARRRAEELFKRLSA